MSTINFSTLSGTDSQKLEALGFMKGNASRRIDRLTQQGSVTKLQAAWDRYEAITLEIEKYTK